MYDMVDDIKMVESSLAGDHQAFGELVDKYKSLVCSIAYCVTGSVESSEDISQDVFVSAWKNLASLREHAKFKSWLVSITRNAVQLYIRRQKAAPGTIGGIDSQSESVAANNDPCDAVITNEENDLVWNTLETLPAEYREVIVLYYRHEKSTAQVAALMEISPDAVRQRLSRGRDMLRDRIERRLETNLRNTAPGKNFTVSVIAAISALPVGVSLTDAAVSNTAAVGHLAAPFYSFVSTTTVKIAALLVAAAAIVTAGIILTGNDKSEPLIQTTKPNIVETQHLASPTADTTNPVPIQTESPVETQYLASPNPDATNTSPIANAIEATELVAEPEGFVPRGVLSGLITDIKTGEPVIDAQINIGIPNGSNVFGSNGFAYTDENGFYYFDELASYGNCELSVYTDEYVGLRFCYGNKRSLNIVPDTQMIQHLQLEKACMLELEAVDEQNKPVKDVSAVVVDMSAVGCFMNNHIEKTGDDGKIIIGGIKPSNTAYNLAVLHSVRDPNSNDTVSDYVFTSQTITLNDPEVIEYIKVVMKKGIDINGRLLYANGIPANNLQITAEPKWKPYNYFVYPRFKINDDGTFTLKHIKPGVTEISTVTKAKSETIATMSLKEGDFLDLVLPYEDPSKLVNFTGKIIIEGDCDIRYVQINGSNSADNFNCQIDVLNGSKEFTFNIDNIKPGIYKIDINSENAKSETLNNVSIPSEGFTQTLQCLPKINISGIILDHKNQTPIKDLRILPRFTGSRRNYVREYSWINYTNVIEGKVQIEVNEEGGYQFFIHSNGYAPKTIEINTIENNIFTAELTAGNTLTGKVIDRNGQGIGNVKLIPFTKNGKYDQWNVNKKIFLTDTISATTDDDGSFTLDNLPENSETIKIQHPDYAAKTMDVQLPDAINQIVITLDKGGCIEGYAYDNDGNIRTNFPLVLQNYPRLSQQPVTLSTMTTTTDEKGYYKFINLPEKYCFVMYSSGYSIDGVCRNYIVATAGQTTQLNLGGTYFLTGRIFVNGLPLTDTNIAVVETLPYNDSFFINNCHTESDGSFIFSGITGGRKKLVYETWNSKIRWSTLKEFDTTGTDCDLGDILINTANIEVSIKADFDIKIQQCVLAEDFGHSLTGYEIQMNLTDAGTFAAENIIAGRYVLQIYRRPERAMFACEIEIPASNEPFILDIQLPHATSSIYGKLAPDNKDLMCRKDDLTFVSYIRSGKDGRYKITNMPAGKYTIKNNLSETAFITFELKEDEAVEIDLDKLL